MFSSGHIRGRKTPNSPDSLDKIVFSSLSCVTIHHHLSLLVLERSHFMLNQTANWSGQIIALIIDLSLLFIFHYILNKLFIDLTVQGGPLNCLSHFG